VKRIEPDPPSLPASTVDVVPSSAMKAFEAEKRRSNAGVIVAAVVAMIVLAAIAFFLRHR
jgi:hypothetical protein